MKDLNDIRKDIKIDIFASGTADKILKSYRINPKCVYNWDIQDEAFMKKLKKYKEEKKEEDVVSLQYMKNRHGHWFEKCYIDDTLDIDYDKFPVQCLLSYEFNKDIKEGIEQYNLKNKTKYGISFHALLELERDKKNIIEITEKDKNGKDIKVGKFRHSSNGLLIKALETIIKNRPTGYDEPEDQTTVMKRIEHIQHKNHSNARISTVKNPRLFIIYLPLNTGNISILQRTLKQFIEKNKLWEQYNIEYSSSSDNIKEYNQHVKDMMDRTRVLGKKGCILFLGNQGSTGITYPDCDVTIHLDNGHSLDNQKQRLARAGTEAEGKTIFINVDMNVQRTFAYMFDLVQSYKYSTKNLEDAPKTFEKILDYFYTSNIFLFNPDLFKGEIARQIYYGNQAEELHKILDDTEILQDFTYSEDLLRKVLGNINWDPTQQSTNVLPEGQNQDLASGTQTIQKETPKQKQQREKQEQEKQAIQKELVNITQTMFKTYMFPLLALISKSYNIPKFQEIFTKTKTKNMIKNMIIEKILIQLKEQIETLSTNKKSKTSKNKIDLKNNLIDDLKKALKMNLNNKEIDLKDFITYNKIKDIMIKVLDENEKIVIDIKQLYATADHTKIRSLIAKHFIPSDSEKKQNAEIPTPVKLVDEMINTIPEKFWKTPKRVFEPCCGKGNFVLGIFDKFYNGLKNKYPVPAERCKVIIEQCLYYADITELNVFITTEILKCHIQKLSEDIKTEEDMKKYMENIKFNSYVGDTLKLNIDNTWGVKKGFDAVIGNPPYNASQDNTGKKGGGDPLWNKFIKISLAAWVKPEGYLVFVNPGGWRKPDNKKSKFHGLFDLMTKQNQMVYLEIHNTKDGIKTFGCGTRYDWYLIQKKEKYTLTTIVDDKGKRHEIDLSSWKFLPNNEYNKIKNILKKNDQDAVPIIYSRSIYGSDKKDRMSSIETEEFKYPCIHSIPQTGTRYMYSNVNDKGHFGVSKVIFGDTGMNDVIIDMDGEYCMTNHSMAIQVDTLEEAESIKEALLSDKFKLVLKACSWSNFMIDWNLFKYFKKDFWKEFL